MCRFVTLFSTRKSENLLCLRFIHTCDLLHDHDYYYVQEWAVHLFLPPTNEVRGKVICLQVCICPQGGCLVRGWGVPAPKGVWSGACACSGGGCLLWGEVWSGGGACSQGGLLRGGPWWGPPQRLLLWTVRILLECILLGYCDCDSYSSHSKQSQLQSHSQPQSRNKWQV